MGKVFILLLSFNQTRYHGNSLEEETGMSKNWKSEELSIFPAAKFDLPLPVGSRLISNEPLSPP